MDIVWNIYGQSIVASLYSKAAVTAYTFVLRDVMPFSIAVAIPQSNATQPYVATDLSAGQSILLGIKLPSSLSSAPLVRQATWTKSGSGATARYAADVSFNTAALITAIGSSASLALTAELTMIDADNSHRYSTQIAVTIIPDLNREGEISPIPLANVIEQFIDGDGVAKVRICNSNGATVAILSPL